MGSGVEGTERDGENERLKCPGSVLALRYYCIVVLQKKSCSVRPCVLPKHSLLHHKACLIRTGSSCELHVKDLRIPVSLARMISCRSTGSVGFYHVLPFLLVLGKSTVEAMSTGDYVNTVSEEPAVIGECMQLLTPSFQKIFDMEHICHELDRYMACYVFDVRKAASLYHSPLPLDLFHDVHSTNAAYQGVCKELTSITPNRHCVQQKELELRKCNEDLNAVSSHLESNYYDIEMSTQYLCRAFQEHASCESLAFSSCDADLGHAMANFYIAALPTTCKILLGVSSKYDDIIFGPFWMGIPVECFPKEEDRMLDARGDTVGTTYTRLCRHYETFIPCLEDVVQKRNRTGLLYDIGAYDLFDAQSQMNAYRSFCPIVSELAGDLECVQTPNITLSESCSLAYSEAAYQLENDELSLQEKRNIMCKATVGLLRCEQQAYTACTSQTITAYNNYNVAILPKWCRSLANIESPFDEVPSTTTTTTKATTKRRPTITATKKPKTTTTMERLTSNQQMADSAEDSTSTPKAVLTPTQSHPEFMPAYTTENGKLKLSSANLVIIVLIGSALLFT